MIRSDSTFVNLSLSLDSRANKIDFDFAREPNQSYYLTLLPGAVTDFFNTENDSVNYNLSTKAIEDYGNLSLKVEGKVNYPLLVQLTDEKGAMKRELYATEEQVFKFKNIDPATYKIRIIVDANANQKWDTGSLLQKVQPERVVYYPEVIEVRANWELEQTFRVEE